MKECVVIFERGAEDEENWGAYVPDLPGCVTTGETLEEARRHMKEAIRLHLKGLQEDGLPLPEPTTQVERIAVAA